MSYIVITAIALEIIVFIVFMVLLFQDLTYRPRIPKVRGPIKLMYVGKKAKLKRGRK